MRMVILTILLNIGFSVFGQDKEIEAQFYYTQAEKFYNEGKYYEVIDELKKCIKTLGKSNSKIEYLGIKTQDKIYRNLPDTSIISSVKKNITNFFKITNQGTYPKEKYFEILELKDFYNDDSKTRQIFKNYCWEKYDNFHNDSRSPAKFVFTNYKKFLDSLNELVGYSDIKDLVLFAASRSINHNLTRKDYGWKPFPGDTYDYSGYMFYTYFSFLKSRLGEKNDSVWTQIGDLISLASDYMISNTFTNIRYLAKHTNATMGMYAEFLLEVPYIIENIDLTSEVASPIWSGLRKIISGWGRNLKFFNDSDMKISSSEFIKSVKSAIEKREIQNWKITEPDGKAWSLKDLPQYSKIK